MVRLGAVTDSHGPEQNKVVARAMAKQGAKKTMHLGDISFKTQSPITNSIGNKATTTRTAILRNTSLRKAMIEGKYSDEVLETLMSNYTLARDVAEEVAETEYSQLNDAFNQADVPLEVVLGGNWDRKAPLNRTFGDRHVNNRVADVEGVHIFGVSGGGSPPVPAFRDGLMADDPETDSVQYRGWTNVPLTERIDILATHVPPFYRDDDSHKHAEEVLSSLLERRVQAGLEAPGAVFSGHTHTGTKVSFQKIKAPNGKTDTTLWVQPGVAGKNHNKGTYGSFVIVDVDDETKKVTRVEEYRVYNSAEGIQDVELHGEHIVDYENQEVTFNDIGKQIISERNVITFRDNLTLDKNHKLKEKGLSNAYEGLSAKEKDSLLQQNIIILQDEIEDVSEMLKGIVDDARRTKRDKTIKQVSFEVFDQIAEKAAQSFNINLDRLRDDDLFYFFQAGLTQAAYGIGLREVISGLNTPEEQELPFNWGADIGSAASNALWKQGQNYILSNLEAEDVQEMAELYLPVNVKRRVSLDLGAAINLYAKSLNTGIITEGDALGSKAYVVDKSVTLTPRTEEELADKLGVEKLPETGYDAQPTEEEIDNGRQKLRDAIKSGTVPILSMPQEYISTPQGLLPFNPEEFGLRRDDYTPQAVEDIVNGQEKRPGQQGEHYQKKDAMAPTATTTAPLGALPKLE